MRSSTVWKINSAKFPEKTRPVSNIKPFLIIPFRTENKFSNFDKQGVGIGLL